MSDVEIPFAAMRDQVNNAIDIVVQLTRHSDGTRRIVEIAAVTSQRREDYRLHTIAEFDPLERRFVQHTVPESLARALALAGEPLPDGVADVVIWLILTGSMVAVLLATAAVWPSSPPTPRSADRPPRPPARAARPC